MQIGIIEIGTGEIRVAEIDALHIPPAEITVPEIRERHQIWGIGTIGANRPVRRGMTGQCQQHDNDQHSCVILIHLVLLD
jgi:hypothetical protein